MENEKQTTYTITIINNLTGETEFEEKEAQAILGAVANEGGCYELGCVHADAMTIAQALHVAERSVKNVKANCPAANTLLVFMKKLHELVNNEGETNE